jgi:hypothetical protein
MTFRSTSSMPSNSLPAAVGRKRSIGRSRLETCRHGMMTAVLVVKLLQYILAVSCVQRKLTWFQHELILEFLLFSSSMN